MMMKTLLGCLLVIYCHGSIVINEVAQSYNLAQATYVEIYNTEPNTFNLSSYVLELGVFGKI